MTRFENDVWKLTKNANSETTKWAETVAIFTERTAERHFFTSKFTLEQATKAQRGGRDITLVFL